MTKFNKGDKVTVGRGPYADATLYTVAAAEPDEYGNIVALRDGVLRYELLDEALLEAVPTFPERWVNVYSTGPGYLSRADADIDAHELPRIGVLHLHPDGTTTMEAP